MKEEQLNSFREQDVAIRDALKQNEAELPKMSVDLNARLMQHMTQETRKSRTRVLWPWIAAACVAGVMMIWLTPPKTDNPQEVAQAPVEKVEVVHQTAPLIAQQEPKVAEPTMPQPKLEKKVRRQVAKVEKELVKPVEEEKLIAQEIVPTEKKATQEASTVTISERDIPITRPENLKYTPEELALMKKQANEAYLKWVELELEIAKYNLEQTAQK